MTHESAEMTPTDIFPFLGLPTTSTHSRAALENCLLYLSRIFPKVCGYFPMVTMAGEGIASWW